MRGGSDSAGPILRQGQKQVPPDLLLLASDPDAGLPVEQPFHSWTPTSF